LFHVDKTIVVSRGFLEIVPDESTLMVFLAHELAHMALETAANKQINSRPSVFEYGRRGEFPGLGIKHGTEEEGRAATLTCGILNGSACASSIRRAAGFVEQLASMSRQISNLTRARFGVGLIEHSQAVQELASCGSSGDSQLQAPPPELRGAISLARRPGNCGRAGEVSVYGTSMQWSTLRRHTCRSQRSSTSVECGGEHKRI
jgi:hypothetical protein